MYGNPQLAVERLGIPVLPGTPGRDKERLDAQTMEPAPHHLCAERGAMIRAQVLRDTPFDDQCRQGPQDIVGREPAALRASEFSLTAQPFRAISGLLPVSACRRYIPL